jgi:hypothetical protein
MADEWYATGGQGWAAWRWREAWAVGSSHCGDPGPSWSLGQQGEHAGLGLRNKRELGACGPAGWFGGALRRFALLLERVPPKAIPESMVGIWDSYTICAVLAWVSEVRILRHGRTYFRD